MKTSFHRKNNSKKKIFGYILLVILIVLFIASGWFQPVASIVSAPFVYVGNLAESALEYAGIAFTSERKLLDENKILKERINKLELELALGEGQEADSERAEVLIRPPENIYGTLIVKKEGDVSVGDVVLSTSGIFIGEVQEVNFSRVSVRLTSHPGFSGEFSVERSGLPIRIEGVGGGNMVAELPQGSDIEKYDVVVDLESGRVVAEVGEVDKSEADAFIKAYLSMPVNIFEITEVLIVKS